MSLMSLRPRRRTCLSCNGNLLRSFISAVYGAENQVQALAFLRGAHHYSDRITRSTARQIPSNASWQTRNHAMNAIREPQRRSISRSIVSQAATARRRDGNLVDDDIADLMFETSTTPTSHHSAKAKDIAGTDVRLEPEDETSRLEDVSTDANATTAEYVPWYLQDSSSEIVQPTAAGQNLPEMPEHPPELLEPITKHVLDTLGISHLQVLDLREMTDPPPALGANLIMVIGTARSERHLHASADKLCRWLRTEYKMTPFADGLLGRNEMKIAIRRRARRAKMMSAVGAKTVDDGADIADGLRSGWICVNVGRVDGGVLPEHAAADRGIVGFGTTSTSTTLVFQMMIEEKREEMALEDLWSKALRAQQRRKAELLQQTGEESSGFEELLDAKIQMAQDESDHRPMHAQS